MLSKLHIQNLALIEDQVIEFNKGLSVISGETGAGKSIILDAINFVLGSRADKNLIRFGFNSMKVEALFELSETEINSLNFIEILEPNLIISRSLNLDGKSDIRINGGFANLQTLKQVSNVLVDFTKQNDNLSILDQKNYISYIDSFENEALKNYKTDYSFLLNNYKGICAEINNLGGLEENKNEKLEYLEYQINEIEKLNLSIDEEIELIKRKNQMHNSEKIINSLKESVNLISDLPSYNILSSLNTTLRELNNISSYSEEIGSIIERLNSVKIEIEDISETLDSFKSNFYFDSNEYDSIENRLDVINNIKRKHNGDLEKVLNKLTKMKEEYNYLIDSEEKYKNLILQKDKIKNELIIVANKITKERKCIAKTLEESIKKELNELEMKNSLFKINFSKSEDFKESGNDSLEFLFTANVGQDLKPISKVISGGEMNRFLLAFKCVLNNSVLLDKTLIFDEIDAGISGKTGTQIAYKLKKISNNFQVICISHLSQICAISDNNYLVSKIVNKEKTYSNIKLLNEEEKINEVARLNGGVNNTELSINHAKEIINSLKN